MSRFWSRICKPDEVETFVDAVPESYMNIHVYFLERGPYAGMFLVTAWLAEHVKQTYRRTRQLERSVNEEFDAWYSGPSRENERGAI